MQTHTTNLGIDAFTRSDPKTSAWCQRMFKSRKSSSKGLEKFSALAVALVCKAFQTRYFADLFTEPAGDLSQMPPRKNRVRSRRDGGCLPQVRDSLQQMAGG